MITLSVLLSLILLSNATVDGQQWSLSSQELSTIQNDVKYLTNGVSSISLNGTPGTLVAFGKTAYVLSDTSQNSGQIWAAARMGSGKICAFAHTVFCDNYSSDNNRAVENCINWMSKSSSSVGLLMTDLKYKQGYIKSPKNDFGNLTDLQGIDFVVAYSWTFDSQNKVDAIKEFVKMGGGLYVCATPWTVNDLTTFGANNVLFDAGLVYADAYGPTPSKIENVPMSKWWASNLWFSGASLLQANSFDPTPKPSTTDQLTNFVKLIAGFILGHQKNDFTTKFHQAISSYSIYERYCKTSTFKFPIDNRKNPLEYTCVSFIQALKDSIPLNGNHPIVQAARIIPGYPNGGRSNNTISVTIPQTNTWWQTTGVFVWPGSVIRVSVPSSIVNSNYKLQVGCHTDDVTNRHNDYKRWPIVSMSVPIPSTDFTFISYSGGLIYLVADQIKQTIPVTVTFSGAVVRSPRFVLGKTSESEWKTMMTSPSTPLVEIESELMVVIFNAFQAKQWVTDVNALARWYDNVFQKYYDITGSPKRSNKQFVVVDVQISAGYGHSGNPIMADDGYDSAQTDTWTQALAVPAIDVAKYDKFESVFHWGIFHEIGHNFQKSPWTASTEGEVTNNIFAMYLEETYPDGPNQFGAYLFGPRKTCAAEHPELCFYVDLREAFGWEGFKQFYRVFEANASITKNNDQDVRDNWLRYFSQVVKRDISSLFVEYKRSFSNDAKTAVSKYKPWNVNDIVDCKTAAFPNSPCMTVTLKKGASQVCIDWVTWVRINTSEALEITFKGGQSSNTVSSFATQTPGWVKSFTFNQSTQVMRILINNRINPEQKLLSCARVNNGFSYSGVSVKVVAASNSQTVNVSERNVEGIYTEN